VIIDREAQDQIPMDPATDKDDACNGLHGVSPDNPMETMNMNNNHGRK